MGILFVFGCLFVDEFEEELSKFSSMIVSVGVGKIVGVGVIMGVSIKVDESVKLGLGDVGMILGVLKVLNGSVVFVLLGLLVVKI